MPDRPIPLTAETIADVARLGSATIHEAAGRIGALPATIRPVDPAWRIAGPARTVRTAPGDNLAIHHAIYASAPGDILVVATGDEQAVWGYWGEIMSWAAHTRGLAGLILQGGSRDHAILPTVGFPVFSLGPCIRGTVKHEPNPTAGIDVAVQLGDIHIEHGDLIVGDIDGVVAISAASAADAIANGLRREAHEADVIAKLRAGASTIDLYQLHRPQPAATRR